MHWTTSSGWKDPQISSLLCFVDSCVVCWRNPSVADGLSVSLPNRVSRRGFSQHEGYAVTTCLSINQQSQSMNEWRRHPHHPVARAHLRHGARAQARRHPFLSRRACGVPAPRRSTDGSGPGGWVLRTSPLTWVAESTVRPTRNRPTPPMRTTTNTLSFGGGTGHRVGLEGGPNLPFAKTRPRADRITYEHMNI